MGGVGLGAIGVLPPQYFGPEVTWTKLAMEVTSTTQLKSEFSRWTENHLRIVPSVDNGSFHVTLGIAWIKGEGLTALIRLTTSLKRRKWSMDGWGFGNLNLAIFCISTGEVVMVVSIVISNLEQGTTYEGQIQNTDKPLLRSKSLPLSCWSRCSS